MNAGYLKHLGAVHKVCYIHGIVWESLTGYDNQGRGVKTAPHLQKKKESSMMYFMGGPLQQLSYFPVLSDPVSSHVVAVDATESATSSVPHRISSAASVSSGESNRRLSYISCRSRITGPSWFKRKRRKSLLRKLKTVLFIARPGPPH